LNEREFQIVAACHYKTASSSPCMLVIGDRNRASATQGISQYMRANEMLKIIRGITAETFVGNECEV
jgi:hypothetical protein